MSVRQMRKLRCALAGSKATRLPRAISSCASTSRNAGYSSCARGVGSMPWAVRVNRRSSKWRRSLFSAVLAADCARPSRSAALETLPLW